MSLKLGGLRGDGKSFLAFWGNSALKSQGSPEAQQTVKQMCNLEEKVEKARCCVAQQISGTVFGSWNKTEC
jgi:hypothetical protein